INAFNPTTGAFLGVVTGVTGTPLVNSGLWDISFHAAATGFDPNTLYFVAGINNEADGLFGTIQFAPEPSTFGLSMTVLAGGALLFRRQSFFR
ncbi:MAG: PEP-CTERM sorting domain-containing protein, partial [Acidobacteriota bacterium]